MNPYRCENCTKEDCWYFKMRDDSRNFKDKYGELLSPSSFTWEKGCASHSDFQPERKKVLDEVWNKLISEMNNRSFVDADGDFHQGAGLSMDELEMTIEGLRQKEGKPGNHRIPKEMECFGSAYLKTDEICILCRASEDCSKWCSRNNRNRVLDELVDTIKEDFTVGFDGDITITYGGFLFNVNSLRQAGEP